jgi:tetratricopeptide (TPR) repeat protein
MQLTKRLDRLDDRTLRRVLIGLVVALVVGVPLVAGLYWLDRHPAAGPSLAERDVAAAEDAVRANPNDLDARNHLAAAYVSAGRFDDGIAQFTEILGAAPENRPALLGRGLAYLAASRLDEAAADFQSLVDGSRSGEFAASDPQLEQAYYELGVVALQQNRPADAVTALESALAIDGADADALNSYGLALIRSGNPTKGVAALRQAIQFVPTGWCDPYQGLAEGYGALGDATGAQYAAGMIAFCTGDPQTADQTLQPLVGGPMSVDALLGLAVVAASTGDNATAIDDYRQVLATDPTNTSALIGLGQLGAGPEAS